MDELIQTVSARLGVADHVVRKAVKVLLRFAKKQMESGDFERLINKMPGAADLLAEPEEQTTAAGAGLFGGLSSLLGGQAGEAAAAFAELKSTGLDGPQIASFVQIFLTKAREVAGEETVDAILKEIPLLQGFLKGNS